MSSKYTLRYLDQNEFSLWDSFVDECRDGTIFNKSFWLDNLFKYQKNVSFKILGCFDKDDNLIGGFAFGSIKKLSVFSIIVFPTLTPYSSILIRERNTKYSSKSENYKLKIAEEFITFLNKRFSQINILLPPTYKDIRGFTWSNYSGRVLYTYQTNFDNIDELFDSFDPDVKRQIKKMENNDCNINYNDSTNNFFELQNKSFLRQQHAFKLSKDRFFEFINDIESKKCHKVCTIYKSDQPVYSVVIILDNDTAYYWLAGGDPDFFSKGYNKVLLWEIIKELKKDGINYFDFVGANTPGVSQYKANFGFNLVPYYQLERTNNPFLKYLLAIKSIFKK